MPRLPIEQLQFAGDMEPLRQVARAVSHRDASEVLRELVPIVRRNHSGFQIGATWLIKDLLERGAKPPARFGGTLISLLKHVQAEDAKLHVLQSLPYVELPPSQHKSLFAMLRGLLKLEHKFVRAWAYNGLAMVANAAPSYRSEVRALFNTAEKKEAASVRARIRHARKLLS